MLLLYHDSHHVYLFGPEWDDDYFEIFCKISNFMIQLWDWNNLLSCCIRFLVKICYCMYPNKSHLAFLHKNVVSEFVFYPPWDLYWCLLQERMIDEAHLNCTIWNILCYICKYGNNKTGNMDEHVKITMISFLMTNVRNGCLWD